MTPRISLACFFLGGLLFSAGAAPAQSLLILPFERSGGDPGHEWIGRGLAELSAEHLAGEGRSVIAREEWLAALEKLGLPASGRYTRATMLRIAEEVDADFVVFGSFSSDGKKLTAAARVLRLTPLGLSAEFSESGTAESLPALQARLSAQVLGYVYPARPVGSPAAAETAPWFRLDAFEQYIRGLVAAEEPVRLRHWREAARLAPDWTAPPLALGQAYFSRRDCTAALTWFSRIPAGQRGSLEAAFANGVCSLMRDDPARAAAFFTSVMEHAGGGRLPEVLNNLGVARWRQGKWAEAAGLWEEARKLDPDDADYRWNAGLAALHSGDASAATRAFRAALRLSPDDAEVRASLVRALERSGRAAEAAAEREAGALAVFSSSPAPRWKARLSGPAPGLGGQADNGSGRRAGHAQLHLSRARELLAAEKLAEAQREFSEAVLLAPIGSGQAPEITEARTGLAEVYRRQGRSEDALRELRAALWARDDPEVRLRLARLLIELDRAGEARAELRAALQVNPAHAAARRLLDSMGDGTPGGKP